jgi:hypothetical protein
MRIWAAPGRCGTWGLVGPEDPARRPDVAELRGEAEQPQAKPEEDAIIDHGADPPAHRLKHDKHEVTAPLVTRRSGSQVSGELGDCSC